MWIKDPAVKKALLLHLVSQVDLIDAAELVRQGYDPAQLRALRSRSIADLNRLAEMDEIQFAVSIVGLAGGIARSEDLAKEDEIRDYLLDHGASRTMLQQLLRIDRAEAVRLRAVHPPRSGNLSGGRPTVPPPRERPAIHNAWADITKRYQATETTKYRLRRLHEAYPTWSLDALWSVLHEFSRDEAPAPATTTRSNHA